MSPNTDFSLTVLKFLLIILSGIIVGVSVYAGELLAAFVRII